MSDEELKNQILEFRKAEVPVSQCLEFLGITREKYKEVMGIMSFPRARAKGERRRTTETVQHGRMEKENNRKNPLPVDAVESVLDTFERERRGREIGRERYIPKHEDSIKDEDVL